MLPRGTDYEALFVHSSLRMPSRLKKISFGLVGGYLAICLAACTLQRSLLYFPGDPPTLDPDQLGLTWRDVTLKTEDGESLGAWFVEAPSPRGCVLISHGNAGSLQHRLGLTASLVQMGFSVLLYDYRGYGTSTGSPSEDGLYLDGTTAYNWLLAEGWRPDQIILWGESLGGGVATELATRFESAGLVLDHSFTSAVDAGSYHYPWLPVSLLSTDRFESLEKFPQLKLPILIIHSPEDRVIPYEQAERLHAAAQGRSTLVTTEGGHNGLGFMSRERYHAQVLAFMTASTSDE